MLLSERPDIEIVVYDKLTYAGNLANLATVQSNPRYRFVRADICDAGAVRSAAAGIDVIVNFAAETHAIAQFSTRSRGPLFEIAEINTGAHREQSAVFAMRR